MPVARNVTAALAAVAISSFVIACANPGGTSGLQSQAPATPALAPTSPSPAVSSVQSAGSHTRRVTMMDACDGPSFNALFGPPPVCSRSHGLEVDKFLALLGDHQDMGAWHNSPSQTDAWVGDTLVAVNNGGEEHTFTRVADFGGGFVPELNALVGTPVPAPECADPSQIDDFVDPGGSDTETLDTTGEIKFQCCIHPWMRTTVLVKSH